MIERSLSYSFQNKHLIYYERERERNLLENFCFCLFARNRKVRKKIHI
jgi:hypothetical protein